MSVRSEDFQKTSGRRRATGATLKGISPAAGSESTGEAGHAPVVDHLANAILAVSSNSRRRKGQRKDAGHNAIADASANPSKSSSKGQRRTAGHAMIANAAGTESTVEADRARRDTQRANVGLDSSTRSRDQAGQSTFDHRKFNAGLVADQTQSGGRQNDECQHSRAAVFDTSRDQAGHQACDNLSDSASLVAQIREHHRTHQDFQRAAIRLELQIQSIIRRHCRADIEKQLQIGPLLKKQLRLPQYDGKTIATCIGELTKFGRIEADGKFLRLKQAVSMSTTSGEMPASAAPVSDPSVRRGSLDTHSEAAAEGSPVSDCSDRQASLDTRIQPASEQSPFDESADGQVPVDSHGKRALADSDCSASQGSDHPQSRAAAEQSPLQARAAMAKATIINSESLPPSHALVSEISASQGSPSSTSGASQTVLDIQNDRAAASDIPVDESDDCPLHVDTQTATAAFDSTSNESAVAPMGDFFRTLPLQQARDVLYGFAEQEKRAMEKLAKQLPIAPWVESINGFGWWGFAAIVAEAGDLSKYANPDKLVKRMGLAVFDGKSQRRVAGAGAIEQGYNPKRRSIMWNIEQALMKGKSVYRKVYEARCRYEATLHPEFDLGIKTDAKGREYHSYKKYCQVRASRVAVKALLIDLWCVWNAKPLKQRV